MVVLGDALFETFGPFVVPAALFVGGVLFYAALWWIQRRRAPPT